MDWPWRDFLHFYKFDNNGVTNLRSHTDCTLFTLLSVSVIDKCESVTVLFLLHNFFTFTFSSGGKELPLQRGTRAGFPRRIHALDRSRTGRMDKVAEKYGISVVLLSNLFIKGFLKAL